MSPRVLTEICNDILPTFPQGTVELVALHPFRERVFEWTDIPSCVKDTAEMRLHGPVSDDLYSVYGVDQEKGAIVVVRPDSYVGMVCSLANSPQADSYLRQCLVKVV